MSGLYKLFGFDPNKNSLRVECSAGVTTFLTMAYILAVNPSILADAGMDHGAAFTATALASAFATLLIAIYAKLPLAQAPGMGLNAFMAYTVVLAMGYSWQEALAAVFIEGLLFILLTLVGIREKLIEAIPANITRAIPVGIGLFISFIGLQNAGIITNSEATLVQFGDLNVSTSLAFVGIILTAALSKLNVRGALLISILTTTILAIIFKVVAIPEGFSIVSMPHSIAPTFMQFDFSNIFTFDMAVIIILMTFMDMFDTVGTLVATTTQAGLVEPSGRPLRMKQSLMSDAISTSVGAMLGTSTVSTYVESAAGITAGGRTGITSLVVAALFVVSLIFAPLFMMIPSVATVGVLVMVGVTMSRNIVNIDFKDVSEAFPAFLTIMMMMLTYSIAEGISIGIISYAALKIFTGDIKSCKIATYVLALLFALRYIYQ